MEFTVRSQLLVDYPHIFKISLEMLALVISLGVVDLILILVKSQFCMVDIKLLLSNLQPY